MPSADPRKITIEFDPHKLKVCKDTDVRMGLSAAAVSDGHLWAACDEGCRLERFVVHATDMRCDHHTTFDLASLLDLPSNPSEEADIEGLDIDDGWLWFVGSHSVKRKKAGRDETPSKVARKLADTKRDGNRHLLVRVPLEGNTPKPAVAKRRAGALPSTGTSSDLLDAIVTHADVHLAPFVDLPGKDNGFDIEGLAVRGMNLFVGLRGPVLREWCCILELALESGSNGTLRMTPVDGPVPYRKHFLNLGGLGVRDLVWDDDDLLILAGPSMTHDGPTEIWRWKNVKATHSGGVPADVSRLLTIPNGEGCDRAEAISLFESSRTPSIVVVFDSPSRLRLGEPASVRADLWRLP